MGRFWQLNRIIKNRTKNGNFTLKTFTPVKPSHNISNDIKQGYQHESSNIELSQPSIFSDFFRLLSKLYKKD